ncbi:MAG: cupin domain-containing protein [Chloroflexota bacterium]|nr:cupin domain-containing protein [Chloroflexota bacterium]
MKTYHYETVPAETTEGLPGVSTRWAIGKNVGAPNFVLRVIEVAPGATTPYHHHPWEHEAFILQGQATLRDAQGKETPAGPGTCVYVAPDEMHCFMNEGEELLRFICVIPYPPEE